MKDTVSHDKIKPWEEVASLSNLRVCDSLCKNSWNLSSLTLSWLCPIPESTAESSTFVILILMELDTLPFAPYPQGPAPRFVFLLAAESALEEGGGSQSSAVLQA